MHGSGVWRRRWYELELLLTFQTCTDLIVAYTGDESALTDTIGFLHLFLCIIEPFLISICVQVVAG